MKNQKCVPSGKKKKNFEAEYCDEDTFMDYDKDGYELNKIVKEHMFIGPKSLLPYKKIIQKSAYPAFNNSLSLEIAQDAITAYEQNNDSLENMFELTIYFLECGTHFASDFGGDMEEDFYTILENIYENTCKKLKKSDSCLRERFAPRLKALIAAADDTGWGYGDELGLYWEEAFGK